MKKMVLFLSACLLIGVSDAQIIIDKEIPGNITKIITAPEYIRMMPGFSYKPELKNFYRAYIDSTYIPFINFVDEENGQRELDKKLEIGSISGSLMVDMAGRANYSIPIHIPPDQIILLQK